jgi:hypothetical protein
VPLAWRAEVKDDLTIERGVHLVCNQQAGHTFLPSQRLIHLRQRHLHSLKEVSEGLRSLFLDLIELLPFFGYFGALFVQLLFQLADCDRQLQRGVV